MVMFLEIRTRALGIVLSLVVSGMVLTACSTRANTDQQGALETAVQIPTETSGQTTNTPGAIGSSTRTPYEPTSELSGLFCNPPETEIWMIPSSETVGVGELLHVDLILLNQESSGAFMGQIQYRLDILPELFMGERVIESKKTIYPGEQDAVSFSLTATEEGIVDLTAKASYELHATDMSWGSWTGCESPSIKIEVVRGQSPASDMNTDIQLHPPNTRSGIPSVDTVLEAVITQDLEAYKDMIHYTVSACTNVMGLGGPPKCQEGELEGTEIEVLPFLGPEGHFLRKDEIEEWDGLDIDGLYTVYLVSEQAYDDPDYPAGEYAIVFLHGHGVSFVTLQIDDGAIVRIDYDLGYPPDEQLLRDASKVILPPLPRQ